METYATAKELAQSNHGWVRDGNIPWECHNFFISADLVYRGYVRVRGDAHGNPGRLDIGKLGSKGGPSAKGCLIVLAALHPDLGKIRVVGFYRDATVYRDAQWCATDDPSVANEKGKRLYRFDSRDVILLPVERRTLVLPSGKDAIGQSDVWYGLNTEKHAALRERVVSLSELSEEQGCNDEYAAVESKLLARHYALERKTQVRRFIFEKGFRCESCAFSIENEQRKIWGSSFEVHHLKPFADLSVGEERRVTSRDVAVLCANCHRAVHRSGLISDIEAFREKHPKPTL